MVQYEYTFKTKAVCTYNSLHLCCSPSSEHIDGTKRSQVTPDEYQKLELRHLIRDKCGTNAMVKSQRIGELNLFMSVSFLRMARCGQFKSFFVYITI
jgi:hypothetical protein